jgi:hypothetical protein
MPGLFVPRGQKLTWEEKKKIAQNTEYRELVRALISDDMSTRYNAFKAVAAELGPVIRKGVMDGPNGINEIFRADPVSPGSDLRYTLHFLAPGREKDYVAYTIPRTGSLPSRKVEGNQIFLTTYWVGNSIEVEHSYVRDAQWNVLPDIAQLLMDGLVKKNNDDGWHCILGAGYDRGILVSDSAAAAGQFSRKLLSLMKLAMVRNGGGNVTSLGRSRLTDIYLSHEAIEDIRLWGSTDGGETTLDRFVVDPQGVVESIYQVRLHPMDEFGVGQEYQDYWSNILGGSMGASDQEICIGLDLSRDGAFVNPIREEYRVLEDPNAQLHNLMRWLTRGEHGFAILDSRAVLVGSF